MKNENLIQLVYRRDGKINFIMVNLLMNRYHRKPTSLSFQGDRALLTKVIER